MQLDAWIIEAAQAAGVQTYETGASKSYSVDKDGVTVQGEREGQERRWRGRILISADGGSLVARQMRQAPSSQDRIITVRAYYENISGSSDRADLYFSVPASWLLLVISTEVQRKRWCGYASKRWQPANICPSYLTS
jgi:flavin-dependent dehydrogenase